MTMSDESPFADVDAKPATAYAAEAERSFPLVSLLQLGAVMGAVAVCIDGKKLWELFLRLGDELSTALILILAAALSAGTIGLVIGLGQRRRWRSAFLGAAVGALVGLLILAIFAAPAPIERLCGGIAMVIVSTVALRIGAD